MPYLLWSLPTQRRSGFVLRILAAAALAVAISLPFLRDQIAAASARAGGSPIIIAPVAVLGPFFDPVLRRLLDAPAYWLVLLPVEFAAFYLAGVIGLFALLKDGDGQTVRVAGLLAAASLVVGWLLRSIVADNNDLGWLGEAAMLAICSGSGSTARPLTTPPSPLLEDALGAARPGRRSPAAYACWGR